MAYSSKVLKQLGRPQGLLGRLILNRLNAVNVGMNDITLKSAKFDKDDCVLEIGFGGGALLQQILQQSQCRNICAIDLSALAVTRAVRIFRSEIDSEIIKIKNCADHALPYDEGMFTKVVCVNVIYFWPDVMAAIGEVYRTTKNDGVFVITYSEDSPDRVSKYPSESVESVLLQAGFSSVSTTTDEDKENGIYHCTVAVKRQTHSAGQ